MMKTISILLVIIMILLTTFSCALFRSEREQRLQEAQRSLIETDERVVSGCEYLGTVQGSVDLGNTFLFFSHIRCKNRAKRNAVALGATHLVWLHVHKTSAVAMAYKCKVKNSGQK
jgi:hypothetical protein